MTHVAVLKLLAHILPHSFQAVAFGVTAATAAKSLRVSYPSKRTFPDAAFRIFLDLSDCQSQPSTSAPASGPKARVSSTRSATPTPSAAPCSSRSITQSLLNDVAGHLASDFPKGMQILLLQTIQESSLTGEPVGFDIFLRAVDACLALEELLDAAVDLFAVLQQQQQASDQDGLQDKLEEAVARVPQPHQAQLRSALSSAADKELNLGVPTVVDMQSGLVELALQAPPQ